MAVIMPEFLPPATDSRLTTGPRNRLESVVRRCADAITAARGAAAELARRARRQPSVSSSHNVSR